jgi:hypothetical protein
MARQFLSSACAVGWVLALGAAGCAEAESLDPRPPDAGASSGGSAGSSGGSSGNGGTDSTGSSGSAGTFGGSSGHGGNGATGSGGAGGQGGGAAAGGSSGAAGSTATGGAAGKGGTSGSGGSSGSAGAAGTGGSSRPDAGPTGRVFFDDFEDGNATTPSWVDGDPALGAVWSVATRDANHVFAQSATASDWVIAVSGDFRWTDQIVEATVKRTSAEGMIGIFGRVVDMRNYYFLYLDGSNIILRKRVDNSSANLVKIKFPTVTGTAYTLQLSIVGTTLTGYVDGVMVVTGSDTFLTSGGIGVGTSDSATGEFDNVAVSR